MSVDFIKINNEETPVKWSTRAKIAWEKRSGLKWTDLFGTVDDDGNYIKLPVTPSIEQSMILCHEALREGHRLQGLEFKMTLDDVCDYNDEYKIESQIVAFVFPKVEDEKKQNPSG